MNQSQAFSLAYSYMLSNIPCKLSREMNSEGRMCWGVIVKGEKK